MEELSISICSDRLACNSGLDCCWSSQNAKPKYDRSDCHLCVQESLGKTERLVYTLTKDR